MGNEGFAVGEEHGDRGGDMDRLDKVEENDESAAAAADAFDGPVDVDDRGDGENANNDDNGENENAGGSDEDGDDNDDDNEHNDGDGDDDDDDDLVENREENGILLIHVANDVGGGSDGGELTREIDDGSNFFDLLTGFRCLRFVVRHAPILSTHARHVFVFPIANCSGS